MSVRLAARLVGIVRAGSVCSEARNSRRRVAPGPEPSGRVARKGARAPGKTGKEEATFAPFAVVFPGAFASWRATLMPRLPGRRGAPRPAGTRDGRRGPTPAGYEHQQKE